MRDSQAKFVHVCLIYQDESEWENTLMPFIREGLLKGEKVIYIHKDHNPEQIFELIKNKYDLNDMKIENLIFIKADESYLLSEDFTSNPMIIKLNEAMEQAISEGYKTLRLTAENYWIDSLKKETQIIYNIMKINSEIFSKFNCTALCQYKFDKFPPNIIENVIIHHPFIIWKNTTIRNIFFLEKEVLNDQLKQKWLEKILDLLKRETTLEENTKNYRTIIIDQPYLGLATAVGLPPKIVMINRGFREILGYDEVEILNMSPQKFLDCIYKEDRHEFFVDYTEVYHNRKSSINKRYRFIDKKGNLLCLRMLMTSETFLDSKSIGMSFIDVTEQWVQEQEMITLREQFLHAQKMESIGRLSAGIAHDFNNLLTAIKGFTQLATIKLAEDGVVSNYLAHISSSVEKAENLIKQLLMLSKGKLLTAQRLNINELILKMEDMIKRIVGEDILLRLNLSPNIGLIDADPTQIEQVIINLVVNARDAMPKGGMIVIETKEAEIDKDYTKNHLDFEVGNYILLSISDTGIGIPKEIIDKIFEPFFTTKKEKGTGLGLSTVYGIVRQHGGSINVYSEPKQGTTFKIYFPRADKKYEKISSMEKKSEIIQGSETLMIIDDDESVRNVLIESLKKLGYKILEASNDEIAMFFAKFYEPPIHLVITDVVMPKINGIELYEKIKRFKPEAKVLLMSGYPGDILNNHGVSIEQKNFIQKPFSIEDISTKIREILSE